MVSCWGTIYGNSLDFLYTVFTYFWSGGAGCAPRQIVKLYG